VFSFLFEREVEVLFCVGEGSLAVAGDSRHATGWRGGGGHSADDDGRAEPSTAVYSDGCRLLLLLLLIVFFLG
jgi:hypothetical protein